MNKLPDIKTNFADWYNEVVFQAELAEHGPIRGTMVIKPYGYALWHEMQMVLDKRIKETGHHNMAFPLLVPESFLKKEAQHIKGFSPELAIVTYAGGKELEEPLVIRPTSETVIHYMFAKWIKSWRDLPMKVNQWANVIRWEKRPRLFLRTTEFFWQEGHTAHATYEEADQEARLMMQEYINFAQDYLAIPVITGLKTESERFPGADKTYTFEGFMPDGDGKALQLGTSHLLSQHFAQAFGIMFQDQDEKTKYPYLTSWAVTTRLVGATVMVHGDEKGLILPPRVAPIQVVIIPVLKSNDNTQEILDAVNRIAKELEQAGVRTYIDKDDSKTVGAKLYKWELKGVPVRIEIGLRDIQSDSAIISDRFGSKKEAILLTNLHVFIVDKLRWFQDELFKRAQERQARLIYKGEKLIDFGPSLESKGGFWITGWCQNADCEQELKKYKAFSRCLLPEKSFKSCFHCNEENKQDLLVAKSY